MTAAESDRAPSSRPADELLRNVTAGLVCGFLSAVLSISFGNLLLPPELRAFVPVTIGTALFTNTVLAAIAAFASPIRGVVSKMQEIPVVAMAGMAAGIAAAMAGKAGEQQIVATIIVATALTTMLTGIILLFLGYFRLGGLVRFVPFPVIGGFLAGTGWLIVDGGVSVITGQHVSFQTLQAIVSPGIVDKTFFAVVFVALLVFVTRASRSTVVLPIAILVFITLYNLVTAIGGTSADALRAGGWLLPLPQGGQLWPPIMPADFGLIDWAAMAPQIIGVPGVIIVTVLALLMNASGIELGTGRDIDLDRELRATGIQNLVAGAGGGSPGYPSISLSLLASRLGALDRTVGITVAVVSGLALFLGDLVLRVMPTPMLGSLLLWVGGSLMVDWLVKSVRRLAIWEYLIVLLIFLVIAFVGFAYGILLGLAAAVVLFLVEYGRVDSVRFMLTGRDHQSTFDYSDERREALRHNGEAILIIQLQGFIFFGTADRLRKSLEERVARSDGPPVRFLLIDFQRVTGIDSSTVQSFMRLQQFARGKGFAIVLTGLAEQVRQALTRGSLAGGDGSALRIEANLDQGLHWCETELLGAVAPEFTTMGPREVGELARVVLNDAGLAATLVPYLERLQIGADERLIEQGTPSDDMFFIESGRGAVLIEAAGKAGLRVATVGPGAVVGEVAFYLRTPRSATVVAEEPMVAWRLTRGTLERLQREAPALAFRFHEGVAAIIARRLIGTNQLLRFLAD